MSDIAEPLRGILSVYFTRAGLWFGVSFSTQVLSVLLAAATVLLDHASLEIGIAVGIISLCVYGGRWRADTLRGRAEFLLRQVEFHDGFGWLLDNKFLADAVSQAISIETEAERRGHEQGNFFASEQSVGPSRALANLRESAWWTEQLCNYLAPRCIAVFAIITVLSLWSLLIAASLVRHSDPLAVSSLLTSVLCLIFSGDFLRLPLGYYKLAAAAQRLSASVLNCEGDSLFGEQRVLRLLQEYQIDREKGPLVPDWVWRRRRSHLNEIWAKYGKTNQSPN